MFPFEKWFEPYLNMAHVGLPNLGTWFQSAEYMELVRAVSRFVPGRNVRTTRQAANKDVLNNFAKVRALMRSFAPPDFVVMCEQIIAAQEGLPADERFNVAIGEDPNAESCLAALILAKLRICDVTMFTNKPALEAILPEVNRLIAHPMNAGFISVLGSQLRNWGPNQRFAPFDSWFEFEHGFCKSHGVTLISHNSIPYGADGWAGLVVRVAQEMQKRATKSTENLDIDDWRLMAHRLLQKPVGFAFAAAATGWSYDFVDCFGRRRKKIVTHALGGKTMKTGPVASMARRLCVPPKWQLTSYQVIHKVDNPDLPTLFITDPGIIEIPTVNQRVGMLLLMATMLEEQHIVEQSLGGPVSKVHPWVFPISYFTGDPYKDVSKAEGGRIHTALCGQDDAAARAHELWGDEHFTRVSPVVGQLDAVLYYDRDDSQNKLKRAQGGGCGAGITFEKCAAANPYGKAAALNDGTKVGGPLFVAFNPLNLTESIHLPCGDVSRMHLGQEMFAASINLLGRPLYRSIAQRHSAGRILEAA